MADGESSGKGKWKSKLERMQKRQENKDEIEHETVSVLLDSVASVSAGSIVAYLNGRQGGMPAIARIPIDVIGAGLGSLIGMGLVMSGRSWGRHIAAAGSGMAVWFFGGLAAKYGQKRRREAGEMKSQYDANGNLLTYTPMTSAEEDTNNVQQRPPITAGMPSMTDVFNQMRKAA